MTSNEAYYIFQQKKNITYMIPNKTLDKKITLQLS